ncbi:MAG TPA: hypothetical protein VFH40_07155 [Gemmatimonadales bacterium]|jgi:hypothetical protein|nr:hypothetical protein [Gemmatimonadales bacterium]
MFVTIRRYSPKNGAVNKASLDLLKRQVEEQFLPVIKAVPGFRAYYVMSVANREVITLSFCETEQGIAEATRCASEYILRNPLIYELGQPEITECQVLTSAQSFADVGDPNGNGDGMAAAIALWLEESRGILLSIPEP